MKKNYRISEEKIKELQPDIANWKKDFGEISLVSLDDDQFDCICKIPTVDHIKIANKIADDFDKNKQLVLNCILYPSNVDFSAIIDEERREAIITPIAIQLMKLSGIAQTATVKKL